MLDRPGTFEEIMINRRNVLASGAALVSSPLLSPLLSPLSAFAQAKYPDRPIHLMVPFSPGGVVDVIGRQWAERVKPYLGTIVVENQGGAGGTTATGDVARAAPDGHTILLGNTSIMVLNPAIMAKVPYDPVKDFAPISVLAISASGIMVHPSVPAKTLTEFVAYAKANGDKLSYGSAGAGTMTNLAGELFKQLVGAPGIVHVPYRGAGPSIADLVSGHIPMATINVTGQLLELHRAGKIRILAVTSPQRLKGAPEIPTAIEAGMPDMVAQLFNGLFVPIKTPKPIVDQIYQASQKVMNDPEMQKALTESGLEPITDSSPEKTQAFMQEEVARWGPVVKAAGLKE
jgi:tripartite-type tricarboxylate transporter receptor subunit TctC